MEIQSQGFRYAIVTVVGGEIIVPLPYFSRKRRLDIDLGLLDIQWTGSDLAGRFYQSGVSGELSKQVISQVYSHGGSNLSRFLFDDVGITGFSQQPVLPGPEDQESIAVQLAELGSG